MSVPESSSNTVPKKRRNKLEKIYNIGILDEELVQTVDVLGLISCDECQNTLTDTEHAELLHDGIDDTPLYYHRNDKNFTCVYGHVEDFDQAFRNGYSDNLENLLTKSNISLETFLETLFPPIK